MINDHVNLEDLRALPGQAALSDRFRRIVEDAASEIDRLRSALRPFSEEAVLWPVGEYCDDEPLVEPFEGMRESRLRVGHLRDAERVLVGKADKGA